MCKSRVTPEPVRHAEEDPGTDAELILAFSLQVSQLGVVVISLRRTYPDVFRYGYIQAAADGHGEGCVIAGGKLAYRRRKVAIEAMGAAEESMPEGLQQGVVGNAQTETSMPPTMLSEVLKFGTLLVCCPPASITAEKFRQSGKDSSPVPPFIQKQPQPPTGALVRSPLYITEASTALAGRCAWAIPKGH